MSISFSPSAEFDKQQDEAVEREKKKEIFRNVLMDGILQRAEINRQIMQRQKEAGEQKLQEDALLEHKRIAEQAKQREQAQIKGEIDAKQYRENLQKEKEMQMIRTGTQELRDLERQLRTCHMGRENFLKIKEKQMAEGAQKELKRRELEAAELMRKDEMEKERLKKEDEERKKYALRLAQQEQLIDLQKRREAAYKAFVQEKVMMDMATQEMIEEDKQREFACVMRMREAKRQLTEFLAAREMWKKRLQEELRKEDMRIEQYLASRTDYAEEEKRAKKEQWDKHNEIVSKIAAKIYSEKQKAMEKEQILQALAEIEADEAYERRKHEEMQAAINTRKDLQVAMCQQLQEKALQLQREQEYEMDARRAMLQEMAEKDRIEQMTKERKRIKVMEHRAAVDRMLAEKRLRRQIEMEKIMQEEEQQREASRAQDELIEEERLKILREHAHKLLGFLPSGVLREGDAEKLGPEFMDALKKHNKKVNCT